MNKFTLTATRREGVALVITLLMVALLAFLIVAFFSRTTANRQIEAATKGGVRAEVLARSGVEAIVSDLRAEIVAGSVAATPGANRPLYIPTSNKTMVPSRVVGKNIPFSPGVYANLVKQSVKEGAFFPTSVGTNATPMIPASTDQPTDVPAVNGRFVYYATWQRAEMTGLNAFTSRTTTLPCWVMMTREGIKPEAQTSLRPEMKDYTPGNAKAAIGRFAYNVYDIGGMLDVNAVGYPPVVTSTPGSLNPADIQELKGTLTGADLVGPNKTTPIIPGLLDLAAFATKWKYLASGSDRSKFMTQWRTTAQIGFLRPGSGDNIALGRLDLIRLAKKTVNPKSTTSGPQYGVDGIEDSTPSALPYLTHFTRESNTPTWTPTRDASSMGGTNGTPVNPGDPSPYAYKTNADNPVVPNRAFPGVRVVTSFTRADGTKAVVGEPLVKTRFPLSRLAGLGLTGPVTTGNTTVINGVPSPASAATIQRDFGLVWDVAGNGYWRYAGPTGSIVKTTIQTLNEVANTAGGREPNFFELLKAGILSGSLGDTSDYESFCVNIGSDMNVDAQVIQIGANIIDQADSDSYPTRIGFGRETDWPSTASMIAPLTTLNRPTPTAATRVIAGVEDLPYIHSFVVTPYRRPVGQPNLGLAPIDKDQTAAQEYVNCWLQFVLWKPQQKATTVTSAPSAFRIVYTNPENSGLGMYMDYWGPGNVTTGVGATEWPAGSKIYYGAKNTSPALPANTTITFSNTDTANYGPTGKLLSDFRAPTLLGGMEVSPFNDFACSQPQGNGGGTGATQLPRGMWLGEGFRPERIPGSATHATAPDARFFEIDAANDSRFELQFQDTGNVWRTYQKYDRFGVGTLSGNGFRGRGRYGFTDPGQRDSVSPSGNPAGNGYPHYRALNVAGMALTNADPRSQRFGLMAMYQRASGPDTVSDANDSTGWMHFLKQGWSPLVNKPITAVFGPSNLARFTPSWTGGTNSNPWGGPATGNSGTFIPGSSPMIDPTKFFGDDLTSGEHYKDMDGIARRGDGDTANGVRPMVLTSATSVDNKVLSPMLNRPFRSVGELSYVFRDNPWKTLDFFSASSADAALLDIFSVVEQPSVTAGKLNLNTRNVAALQALLTGALREEATLNASPANVVESTAGGDLSAFAIATKLVANTSNTSGTANTGPLVNVADLANRLPIILPVPSSPATDMNLVLKTRREAVGRALAGAGQVHTWNLMVDVIAQSGRFSVPSTSLSQFVVEGEKRYWLHVAIDRFTGEVIDQQLESVNE